MEEKKAVCAPLRIRLSSIEPAQARTSRAPVRQSSSQNRSSPRPSGSRDIFAPQPGYSRDLFSPQPGSSRDLFSPQPGCSTDLFSPQPGCSRDLFSPRPGFSRERLTPQPANSTSSSVCSSPSEGSAQPSSSTKRPAHKKKNKKRHRSPGSGSTEKKKRKKRKICPDEHCQKRHRRHRRKHRKPSGSTDSSLEERPKRKAAKIEANSVPASVEGEGSTEDDSEMNEQKGTEDPIRDSGISLEMDSIQGESAPVADSTVELDAPIDSDDSMDSSSGTSVFVPDRGRWKWMGSPRKQRKRGRRLLYKGIQRGLESISIGDAAVFNSNTIYPDRPYIGRVTCLWSSGTQNDMNVRVKWFYHPAETVGCPNTLLYPGGIFESAHTDENDVQSISHKCEVLPVADYKARYVKELADTRRPSGGVYYLAGRYCPTLRVIKRVPDLPLEESQPLPPPARPCRRARRRRNRR